jgi:putative Mg2+ transporter-C (MgtC) family protein
MGWYAALDAGHTITHELEIALRLVLAAAAGAVIGFERESKDRPAGLRTNMLVALAAGLFTIITFEIYHRSRAPTPTRSASSRR